MRVRLRRSPEAGPGDSLLEHLRSWSALQGSFSREADTTVSTVAASSRPCDWPPQSDAVLPSVNESARLALRAAGCATRRADSAGTMSSSASLFRSAIVSRCRSRRYWRRARVAMSAGSSPSCGICASSVNTGTTRAPALNASTSSRLIQSCGSSGQTRPADSGERRRGLDRPGSGHRKPQRFACDRAPAVEAGPACARHRRADVRGTGSHTRYGTRRTSPWQSWPSPASTRAMRSTRSNC